MDWIDMDERQPEDHQICDFLMPEGEGYKTWVLCASTLDVADDFYGPITHWRPAHELPKKKFKLKKWADPKFLQSWADPRYA